MDVDKAAVVEEFMDGERRFAADAEHRAEGVGAGTQVGDLAQKLHRMALFLQRVVGRGGAMTEISAAFISNGWRFCGVRTTSPFTTRLAPTFWRAISS